ncbi:unnamed protein product [Moneuplotes crassus]|uniref:Uncharacterized protein n=1 Tax=Euplotes crassus TaxID=5936 RepID=A0AAD2D3Q7_EUPCR|nr:unnamed protein product [Moneuplotes crassus]
MGENSLGDLGSASRDLLGKCQPRESCRNNESRDEHINRKDEDSCDDDDVRELKQIRLGLLVRFIISFSSVLHLQLEFELHLLLIVMLKGT